LSRLTFKSVEEALPQRKLGDLSTSAIGLGSMALAGAYGPVSGRRAVALVRRALDMGVTMIDTSDAYGTSGSTESLIGRAIRGRREQAFVATKWGIAPSGIRGRRLAVSYDIDIRVNASPARARTAVADSLARLGVDVIDLWYLHFPDPSWPIEDTVGSMAEMVQAGYVKAIGLSNVTPTQLRRAHAVHRISALQVEYSLWTRDAESDLLPAARGLGAGIVAWAPLGSGFFTTPDTWWPDRNDFRQRTPRFQPANLEKNRALLLAPLARIADELNVSLPVLALSWLLHQGSDVVPIPGTRDLQHLKSNLESVRLELDEVTLRAMNAIARPGIAKGAPLLG
jgi:aryl-alcohol dehydrogenase-like predicted oxidoreductase